MAARKGTGRSTGLAASVCGEQVWLALAEARGSGRGLSLARLGEAIDLTPYQTGKGIKWFKLTGAQYYKAPLSRTYKYGFQVVDDPDLVLGFVRSECHVSAVRLGNLITGTVIPHTLLHPSDPVAKRLLAQLTGVASLLDEYGSGP